MRSELIICKSPKLKIAEDFLTKAVETHTVGLGFAAVKDGVVHNHSWSSSEVDLKDALEKTQQQYLDQLVYFHLMEVDDPEEENVSANSSQPFNLIVKTNPKGEEESLLSVMLDGDFPKYAKENDETAAYHYVTDHLTTRIQDLYREAKFNIEALCTKLDSPALSKEFGPHITPRGVILFIPAKYKSFCYQMNEEGATYPWGFATRSLGIEPKKEEPKAPPRPLSLKERQKRQQILAGTAATITPPPPVEDKTHPPGGTPLKLHENFYWKDADGERSLYVKPPAHSNWKTAKTFWNAHCALTRPKGSTKSEVHQVMHVGFPASSLKSASSMRTWYEKAISPNADTTAMRTAMEKAKNTEPKHITGKSALSKVDTGSVPGLLTVNDKQIVVGLSKEDGLWLTPEQMLEHVKEFPVYSKQVALPLHQIVTARDEFFGRQGKHALHQICNELRAQLLACWLQFPQLQPREAIEPPNLHQDGASATPSEPQSTSRKALTLKKRAA